MLKFKDIEPDLRQGKHVVIRDNTDKLYGVVSNAGDGNYKHSGWHDKLKDAKEYTYSEPYDGKLFDKLSKEYNFKFHSYYVPAYETPKVGDEMYVLKDYREFRKGDKVKIDEQAIEGDYVPVHGEKNGRILGLAMPLSCLGYLKGKCQQCLNPMQKGICECEAEAEAEAEEEEKCCVAVEYSDYKYCPYCGKKLNK